MTKYLIEEKFFLIQTLDTIYLKDLNQELSDNSENFRADFSCPEIVIQPRQKNIYTTPFC